MAHVSRAELDAGFAHICSSPTDGGRLVLIVRRPAIDEREVLAEGTLDKALGLVGDTWHVRPSKAMPDRSPHPEMQLNVMNARVAALIAGFPDPEGRGHDRRPLAGDQLYLDLDLSEDNLPPGTFLHLGSAIIEVTARPHTGCAKFLARFGADALRFVNSPAGRQMRLRGLNARVVTGGTVRIDDPVFKAPVYAVPVSAPAGAGLPATPPATTRSS
jgi:hypothetical protein